MMETTRGMIGDLIASGEQVQETALSKDDHGWGQMSRISTDSGFREGQATRLCRPLTVQLDGFISRLRRLKVMLAEAEGPD